MRLLFAITVCCFLAVMGVGLALARRIRLALVRHSRPIKTPATTYVKQEIFEAGEFRTPRSLRLEQEILKENPRRPLSEISFASRRGPAVAVEAAPEPPKVADVPVTPRKPEPIQIKPAAAYASLFGQSVPIVPIDSHHSAQHPQDFTPVAAPAISKSAARSAPVEFTLHHKPPQPSRPSGLRRPVDLSQYKKDMDDLTAPYTTQLRGSGTQGPVHITRTDP